MESTWANNSNGQNLENIRQMILKDDLPSQTFRMFVKETTSKPIDINITKRSRKISAETVCKLK